MKPEVHEDENINEDGDANDLARNLFIIGFSILFAYVMFLVVDQLKENYQKGGQIFASHIVPKDRLSFVGDADQLCRDQPKLCDQSVLISSDEIRAQLIEVDNRNAQGALMKYTEGILNVSIWQLYLNSLGMLLLVVAVFQTWQVLREARAATKAARDTLKSTLESEQPFVYFELETEFLDGKKGTSEIGGGDIVVTPVFRNYGRTPAVGLNYHIYISATDPNTNNATQGGVGPSNYRTNLASNQSTNIPSLPPFNMGEYYEFNDRHYVITAEYGYSDYLGNTVCDRKTVHIQVWPVRPGEGDIFDIATREITSDYFESLKAREVRYTND